jgi:glycerol kinase
MTYLCAIDQGTSSSRFIVFDSNGSIMASHQQETSSIYPKEGSASFFLPSSERLFLFSSL